MFHCDSGGGCGAEDAGHVNLVGFAGEELAAGRVAQDLEVRVFEGAEDAGGHLLERLVEGGVDAGDDDVHLGEGLVGEVEGAVGEDVDFDSGEDSDGLAFGGQFAVDFADGGDVFEGPFVVETEGHGQVLRVV